MKDFSLKTFSIIWVDKKTKSIWIATASKWLAVWSIVPYVEAWVWAIATQADTNLSYWRTWLDELKKWILPKNIANNLIKDDEKKDSRQIAIMDIDWKSYHFTWKDCFSWAWWVSDQNCIIIWNSLSWENVIKKMKDKFNITNWTLAEKLVEALIEWEKVWWDTRWKQSAALIVYDEKFHKTEVTWWKIDLRIDDSKTPILDLKKLLKKHYELYCEWFDNWDF